MGMISYSDLKKSTFPQIFWHNIEHQFKTHNFKRIYDVKKHTYLYVGGMDMFYIWIFWNSFWFPQKANKQTKKPLAIEFKTTWPSWAWALSQNKSNNK